MTDYNQPTPAREHLPQVDSNLLCHDCRWPINRCTCHDSQGKRAPASISNPASPSQEATPLQPQPSESETPEAAISICPKCGNHYDKTSNAQECCWKCVPPDAPVADPICVEKSRRIEQLEAIIGDLPFPEEAKCAAGITCSHLARLIIGSESGYICCECWAESLERRARAAEAERKHAVEKARESYDAWDKVRAERDSALARLKDLEEEGVRLRLSLGTIDALESKTSDERTFLQIEVKKLSAELSALRQQLAEVTQWRPIETAPMDAIILAVNPDSIVGPATVVWSPKENAWVSAWNHGDVLAKQPTQWLPIPQKPATP